MCQLEVWPNLLSDSETVQGTEISGKFHQEREGHEQHLQHGLHPYRGGSNRDRAKVRPSPSTCMTVKMKRN